jgi:hypothetical protein
MSTHVNPLALSVAIECWEEVERHARLIRRTLSTRGNRAATRHLLRRIAEAYDLVITDAINALGGEPDWTPDTRVTVAPPEGGWEAN